jgi:hypothetical protein
MIVPVIDIGNHILAMSLFPQAQMKNLILITSVFAPNIRTGFIDVLYI